MLLLTLSTTSCSSNTTYRPKIYGHDYYTMTIIEPVTYKATYCGDPDFNKYVSVKLEDLTKLALVLKKAKLPIHIRIIIEEFNNDILEAKGLAESQSP